MPGKSLAMHPASSYGRIGFIGTGRVAGALALALHSHSADPLHVWGRDPGRRDALAAAIGHAVAAPDLTSIAASCDLIMIAVSDDAIPVLAAQLASHIPTGAAPFIVHMSGRSGPTILAPLAGRGALTAAVHPAMTFTGDPTQEVIRMAGARFVTTAGTTAALSAAQQLVTLLGGVMEQVGEAQRSLYHAALCHAANHLVTLIAGSCDALRSAGIADPAPLLAPLVRAALDNALDRGMAGLSGPLLRGDEDSIRNHIAALAAEHPRLLPSYRAMAVATLDALETAGARVPASLHHVLA